MSWCLHWFVRSTNHGLVLLILWRERISCGFFRTQRFDSSRCAFRLACDATQKINRSFVLNLPYHRLSRLSVRFSEAEVKKQVRHLRLTLTATIQWHVFMEVLHSIFKLQPAVPHPLVTWQQHRQPRYGIFRNLSLLLHNQGLREVYSCGQIRLRHIIHLYLNSSVRQPNGTSAKVPCC